MNRPTLITLFLAFVTCAADAPAKSEPASKPNIIFILTDDQNPDTLGCLGGKVLTPQSHRVEVIENEARQPYRQVGV